MQQPPVSTAADILRARDAFVEEAVRVITRTLQEEEIYWKLKNAAKEEICRGKYASLAPDTAAVDFLVESGLDSRIKNAAYTCAVGLPHPAFAAASAQDALIPEQLGLPLMPPESERLSHVADAQRRWEIRMLKRVASMAQDAMLPLGRTRPPDAARVCAERFAAGEYMKGGDGAAANKMVGHLYDHTDLFEALKGLRNPNCAPLSVGGDLFSGPSTGSVSSGSSGYATSLSQWGSIGLHLSTPEITALQERYRLLGADLRQVGLDDVEGRDKGWFSAERLATGQRIVNAGNIAHVRELAKRGLSSSLRPRAWATILAIDLTKADRALFDQLLADVARHDLFTDRLWRHDVRQVPGNDDNYFPFEDSIVATALAFSRDAWIGRRCGARPNAQMPGRPAQQASLVFPPNGVLPFKGISMTIAPLCFVYADLPIVYQAYRQLYLRYFRWLHTINSNPRGLLYLSVLFESLLQTHQPHLVFHLRQLDVEPLKHAIQWIMQGFAGFLDADQHLVLWDRIIGYDSTELLAIVAVAVFTFRRQALVDADSAAAVELILLDMRALKVVPLLQCCLFGTP